MLDACADIMTSAAQSRESNLEGQLDFFGLGSEDSGASLEKPIPKKEEYPAKQLLALEHEALGMYISGHPADDIMPFAKADKCLTCAQIIAEHERTDGADEGRAVKAAGMVISRKELKTKKGDMMCFAEIEDASSSIELVVFPEVYRAASHLLSQGQLVCVEGKVSGREDEKPKIIAEHIISADDMLCKDRRASG